MAGNTRFELTGSTDTIFPGNHAPRPGYSGPVMDRSGSFRESSDGRVFNSGKGRVRGSGTPTAEQSPLPLSLPLDPIALGDQKYTRSGELRRLLGISVGSTPEDNSFGASHSRNSPPVAIEELRKFRTSVSETCSRASGRAKSFDERLHKLSNLTTSKKQQPLLLASERTSGSNLKIGNQMLRSPSEVTHPKLDDGPKNVILNKRVRTSLAETRAEGRTNGLLRQPLTISRDRDLVKDVSMDHDFGEEKIRKLPAGGETWDKKMKRKRSVGAVCARPTDGDGEPKRYAHHKLTSEQPGLQSSDSQNLRSGSAIVGVNKFDGTPSPVGSNARSANKSEQEKGSLSRDVNVGLNKERLLPKGNIKLNNREESNLICPSPLAKGKASRAPRSGSATLSSVSNAPRASTLESWELSQNINKSSPGAGTNNRKRALPAGSASPPITQWVGQRPQKNSRTRRANLVSPVSNHDEVQTPSEGFSPSEFGSRLASNGTSGSVLSKGSPIGNQNVKVKTEPVASPASARFSESEESGAGENRSKEKGTCSGEIEERVMNGVQSVGTPSGLLKKNKFFVKEDIGDGIRKQSRNGRGHSFSRASMSPVGEKSDGTPPINPLRNMRPASDRNGSKSGRPIKKVQDRKGFSRLGHGVSGGSPDFTGESDDDHEELLKCASLAYNSSVQACSSAFWKKVEGLFTSISSEGKCYLSEQLKQAQEMHERLSQTLGSVESIEGNGSHEEITISDSLSGARSRNKNESKDSPVIGGSFDQLYGSAASEEMDVGRHSNNDTPLFQRVLSAIIIEDDMEEFDENEWGKSASYQNSQLDSPSDDGNKHREVVEFDYESTKGAQIQSNGYVNGMLSHHTSSNYGRQLRQLDSPCDGELGRAENGYTHSEVEILFGVSSHGLSGPHSHGSSGPHSHGSSGPHSHGSSGPHSHGSSSNDCQYEQMCLEDKLMLELQSIGLYVETVPDLQDKEEVEVIDQEIIHLNKDLYQQVGKKKSHLDKIYEAIQGGQDVKGQDLERVAMNKLVETAYKKLLATRGSLAIKNGIPKVSKQAALSFAKRTVARCKKYEDSGISCFDAPALRDIIFAPPLQVGESGPSNGSSSKAAGIDSFDTYNHQSEQAFAKNGPILNRGKKKEVLLDDVSGAVVRTTSLGNSLLGGAKGKRSDRDASIRNNNTKAGRSSLGNSSKGERKTKTKPKQKTAQLSMSGNGLINKFMEVPSPASGSGDFSNNYSNRKRDGGLVSPGNTPNMDSGKEKEKEKEKEASAVVPKTAVTDIDIPIDEELGVGADLGGNHDLTSWFNFDDDGLPEDGAVGLDIPMDDLTELMF